jgi:hypothetical protein
MNTNKGMNTWSDHQNMQAAPASLGQIKLSLRRAPETHGLLRGR